MTQYKFLKEGLKSSYGDLPAWQVGEWRGARGRLQLCVNGFHCSETPLAALRYVAGEALAIVETRGAELKDTDKSCHAEMRIVRAYRWQKADSVALAIYSAELVLGIFEKKYPADKRPRQAIAAAKRWLKNPTEKNQGVAAVAAVAADAAAAASYAAADAAASYAAAYAAARKELTAKINAWMVRRIGKLEEIK